MVAKKAKPHGFRGERLREARTIIGLTQEALNALCNFGPNQIARYETGISDPLPPQIVQIAKALDVTTDWLLGLSDNPEEGHKQQLNKSEQLLIVKLRKKDYLGVIKDVAEQGIIEELKSEDKDK